MKVIHEYSTIDKSEWPRGPWDNEPDKIQGIDEATGFDFLIVRNNGGALCGYVGVPESHPCFGKGYDDVNVEVHGGLTFADTCTEATPELWEALRKRIPEMEAEAAKYPKGDSARALKESGQYRDDFEGYQRYAETRFICHVPQDGASDKVWWLGFDCAHYGDTCPRYDREEGDSWYKDRRYVEREIVNLASQLAEMHA